MKLYADGKIKIKIEKNSMRSSLYYKQETCRYVTANNM